MTRSVSGVKPICQLPEDKATRKLWSPLKKKLLAIDGERVIWPGADPHLAQLVSEGRLFHEPVTVRRGEPHRCHENTAKLWGKDTAHIQIATGYALIEDTWITHSWALREGRLVDSIGKWDKYYGVVLDQDQAIQFFFGNFIREHYSTSNRKDIHKLCKLYPGPMDMIFEIGKANKNIKTQD